MMSEEERGWDSGIEDPFEGHKNTYETRTASPKRENSSPEGV